MQYSRLNPQGSQLQPVLQYKITFYNPKRLCVLNGHFPIFDSQVKAFLISYIGERGNAGFFFKDENIMFNFAVKSEYAMKYKQ